jgi:alkylation response protein AidB-like acyl-CoA dehydrogenase
VADLRLGFSPEQEELRATVRRLLAKSSSSADVRRTMTSAQGYDPELWFLMADQLGLHGLAIPEQYGGGGFSWMEQAAVLEEMGAALLCAPYLASAVMAPALLLHGADEATKADLLPALAAGTLIATVAIAENSGLWSADSIGLQADETPHGWRLDGHKSYVLDGSCADVVLVVARTPQGLTLFAVQRDAAGLQSVALNTLDPTRRLTRFEFDAVPARRIGAEGQAGPAVATCLDVTIAGLCAEMAGGAGRCLETSVAYAKGRIQFGQPIGAFQAIKHKCADMLIEVEQARSAAYYAAWAAAESTTELPAAAALAKAYCSDAYFHVAAENIQIHGGIGFTWEHEAHLYFKRAKSSALLFGSAAHHRRVLSDHIGIPAPAAKSAVPSSEAADATTCPAG